MTNMSPVNFMFCPFSTQPNGVLCTRGFDTFTFICGNNFVIRKYQICNKNHFDDMKVPFMEEKHFGDKKVHFT